MYSTNMRCVPKDDLGMLELDSINVISCCVCTYSTYINHYHHSNGNMIRICVARLLSGKVVFSS